MSKAIRVSLGPEAQAQIKRVQNLPLAAAKQAATVNGSVFSTKLAAGLRSVARNYKATRLLTRPG